MKVKLTCMHVQRTSAINPQTGNVVNANFAVFEDSNGNAIKAVLTDEELAKLTPKKEYDFEFTYSESAGLVLPGVAS